MLYKRRMTTNSHTNMINRINSPFTGCPTGRSSRSPQDVPFRSWCTQTHTTSPTRTRDTLFGTPDTRSHSIIIIEGANNTTRLCSTFAMTPSLNTVEYRCRALPSTHYESRAIILGHSQRSFTRDMRLFVVERREKCGCTTICVWLRFTYDVCNGAELTWRPNRCAVVSAHGHYCARRSRNFDFWILSTALIAYNNKYIKI